MGVLSSAKPLPGEENTLGGWLSEVHDLLNSPLWVRRTTDGSGLTTTATLVDEPVLKLPGIANAGYEVDIRFRYSGTDTTADLLVGFSAPTGATFEWETPDGIVAGATAADGAQWSGPFSLGNTAIFGTLNGPMYGRVTGLYVVGATPGNLQPRVSRNGASGTTMILANSRMMMKRVF